MCQYVCRGQLCRAFFDKWRIRARRGICPHVDIHSPNSPYEINASSQRLFPSADGTDNSGVFPFGLIPCLDAHTCARWTGNSIEKMYFSP